MSDPVTGSGGLRRAVIAPWFNRVWIAPGMAVGRGQGGTSLGLKHRVPSSLFYCRLSLTQLPFVLHNACFRPVHPPTLGRGSAQVGLGQCQLQLCSLQSSLVPAWTQWRRPREQGGYREAAHQQNQGHSPKAQPNALSPDCIFWVFLPSKFLTVHVLALPFL